MSINLKQIILILVLLITIPAFAQKKEKKEKETKEQKKERKKNEKNKLPENIESFPKNFLIRPRFVYPEVSVNVSNRMFGKGEKFKYKPAMPGVVGLSLVQKH